MQSLIGIYSRDTDDHLERVEAELSRRRAPWIRFDTLDFPQTLHLSAQLDSSRKSWRGAISLREIPYRLENFRSIWYRRPTRRYGFPAGLSEDGEEFARAEAQRGFGGLLHALPVRWVSHPDALRAAEWKPKQLDLARQIGFKIPRTLITNDPEAARQFFDECQGEMVYKPFCQGIPRPRIGEPWQGAIYTTKLTRAVFEKHATAIAITVCLFQEYLPKMCDLRITVIGTRVFAAEIQAPHSEQAKIDFRTAYNDLSYRIHALPPIIEQRCLTLVRHLQLQFAAIDMLVTPEQDYIFLELNANGQWGWIEQATGLPLTETLVDLLTAEAHATTALLI